MQFADSELYLNLTNELLVEDAYNMLHILKKSFENLNKVKPNINIWVKRYRTTFTIFVGEIKSEMTELINDTEFIERYFSEISSFNEEDKQTFTVFIYICLALFSGENVIDIFKTKIKMLIECFDGLPKNKKFLSSYWSINNISKKFKIEFADYLWEYENYRYGYSTTIIDEETICELCKRKGPSFLFACLERITAFVCKKVSKNEVETESHRYLVEFVKANIGKRSEWHIPDKIFRNLYSNGFFKKDFFFSKLRKGNSRCFLSIFNQEVFNQIVEKARELPIKKDFFTVFLNMIDYSVDNVLTFISQFPENGYPFEDICVIFSRYFSMHNNNSFLQIINAIKSKELFLYVLGLLPEERIPFFLSRSDPYIRKLGLKSSELINFMPKRNSTYFDLVELFDITLNADFNGVIMLQKYFHNYIDLIIERIDNADRETQTIDKGKIIASTMRLIKIKLMHCIINDLPIEFKLSGRNVTNDDIKLIILDYHATYYGIDNFNNYSFLLKNKTFILKYYYHGEENTMSLCGPLLKIGKELDSTIFEHSWERVFVELFNEHVKRMRSKNIEDFKIFLNFFREHYTNNQSDYHSPNFNFKHCYQQMLQIIDLSKNVEMLNLFIEKTMEFINPRYLEVLNEPKYVEKMKAFKSEEKAEKEVSDVIRVLKRERETNNIFLQCQQAMQDENLTPAMKKLCETVLSHSNEFLVYKYITKNPSTLLKCPICTNLLKTSAFLAFNCGHIICADCLTTMPNEMKICHTCRVPITSKNSIQQSDPIDDELLQKLCE